MFSTKELDPYWIFTFLSLHLLVGSWENDEFSVGFSWVEGGEVIDFVGWGWRERMEKKRSGQQGAENKR